MYPTPNFVVIGSSERSPPAILNEVCDSCWRQVWIAPKCRLILEEADAHQDRSAVLCVGHAMAEYGQSIVVQILLAQREGENG